jgi:hypothetical protein
MVFNRPTRAGGIPFLKSVTERGTVQHKLDPFNILSGGSVPEEYMGLNLPHGGSSMFAGIAHQAQQLKAVDNLLGGAVTDQLKFVVYGPNNEPITTAFKMGGKTWKPNGKGENYMVDKGRLDMNNKIKAYRKRRTDDLMEKYVMDGDEGCAYMFGIALDEWLKYCAADGPLPAGFDPKDMDPTLKKLQCNVQYVSSLGPSLTQSQAMAKLYKLVEFFEPNCNIEGLSTLDDVSKNMKDGHNNPENLSADLAATFSAQPTLPLGATAAAAAATR